MAVKSSGNSGNQLRFCGASGWLRAAVIALATASVGCAAVYPEVTSQVRPVPMGAELKPPPPDDLYFLKFASAEIPEKTRDGRQWDAVGGAAPDSFAMLLVDDVELFRTPVQSNTLAPTWEGQKIANYRIKPGSRLRVELWDTNPVNNHPICIKNIGGLSDAREQGELKLLCDSGARVVMTVQPAHARWGIGLYYELRTRDIYVTRVLKHSPAATAGVAKGQQIVAIQGTAVRDMEEGQARSLVNANSQTGVTLKLRVNETEEKEVVLKNGPLYPVKGEELKIEH